MLSLKESVPVPGSSDVATKAHDEVSILVDDVTVRNWQEYVIESNLLVPADSFSLRCAPVTKKLVDKFTPGAEVNVYVNDVLQMTGIVDERFVEYSRGGSTLELIGRDLAGQLLDCSAPLVNSPNYTLKKVVELMTAGFVREVIWDNSLNRYASVKSRRARMNIPAVGYSPATVEQRVLTKTFRCKTEPGESRWDVIDRMCRRAGILPWMTADGKLVISLPDYDQGALFTIYHYEQDSPNRKLNNVLQGSLRDSIRDRYGTIDIFAQGRGDASVYGAAASKITGRAIDGTPGLEDRWLFLVADDINTRAEAQRKAQYEVDYRGAQGLELGYTVPGHTQAGKIWQVDTMVSVVDQTFDLNDLYFLISRRFQRSRQGGTTTELTLQPRGALFT